MKKVLATLVTAGSFWVSATAALAKVDVVVNQPAGSGVPGDVGKLGNVIGNLLKIIFVLAALMVLFFLIWGAFQWITSGGDKDKIAKARGTIINALIGLVVLALAFLIANVVANIAGIGSLTNFSLPSLGD